MNLKKEIERYSKLNGYPSSSYEDIRCSCDNNEFQLYSDDNEGGCFLKCSVCKVEQDIEDSREYIENAQQNICNCDNDSLNIGVGKAYYSESNELKWVYIGAHCGKCNLDGVYVDWKQN